MAVAVEVRQVSKRYGRKQALHPVSFQVPAGAALGLVGPNGAGKSTLLRILLGLTRPGSGNVWYDGRPLWPHPERALAQVGGFVDIPRFYPYLSGYENMALLADLTRQPRTRASDVLSQVNLNQVRDQRVGGYSHGMRQRLGLAAALLKHPSLIILDEPQDGLDPARQEEMRRLIENVRQELGATFIMSSHVMQDIERLCDQIGVFDAGSLRYYGPPAQLGGGRDEEVLWEVWPLEPALGLLEDLGLWAQVTRDGRVAVPWTKRLDLGDVNEFLIQNGLTVRTVVRRRASLESRLLKYLEVSDVDVR